MTPPEQSARHRIDQLLQAAGWLVQDRSAMSLGAGLGVAVREYQLPAGPCDYLLFVDGKACGVIEAKPEGQTLIGVAEQSEKYKGRLPEHLASFTVSVPLPVGPAPTSQPLGGVAGSVCSSRWARRSPAPTGIVGTRVSSGASPTAVDSSP